MPQRRHRDRPQLRAHRAERAEAHRGPQGGLDRVRREAPASLQGPMSEPPPKADWTALADRLETLADDLMTAAPAAPDETERQLMELHAISLRHIARRLRLFPEEAPA